MKFPDLPMFTGANAPSRIELDIADLEVDGALPEGLSGAFYRVAADHQFPPRFHNDVPFNADGMVSAFRFKDGRVSVKSRYVRTARFEAERAAGRALFGRYRDRWSDDPSVRGMDRNLANTNVILFDGKLLALREDSLPVAMDPATLETLGPLDFHGTLDADTFTAHAKLDPGTGQLVAYGSAARGDFSPEVRCHVIGSDGRVEHSFEFTLPYYAMLHDCGVTQNHIVFPVLPMVGAGEEGLKAGLPHYGWNPEGEAWLGVVRRDAADGEVRWFKLPVQFASHVMNAFEEGSRIHLDLCRSPGNLFPFFPEFGKPFDPSGAQVKLTRWTVDLKSDSDQLEAVETLSDFIGEFPRADERWQTRAYRHGWLLGFSGRRNSMAHVDLAAGVTQVWQAPEHLEVQEPCFAPRSFRSDEGDGWILQAATDERTMLTELNIFEALSIQDGPVATVRLPVRMKPAYHGNWVGDDALRPHEQGEGR